MAPRFAVPGAPAAAAFRGRPGGRAWVDLRSCLELAKELGCYSVTVGAVCITLRLPQDAAAAGRKPGRVAGRPDPAQQRPKRVPRERRSTSTGGSVPPPTSAGAGPHCQQGLTSRQRRSRERARQWHAARAGAADMHSCMLSASTVAAHARWRRLAAAALRYSAWRPWAAARASAAIAAAPSPASRNLLMDTVQGRVALADALVAQVDAAGPPKRKAAELTRAQSVKVCVRTASAQGKGSAASG